MKKITLISLFTILIFNPIIAQNDALSAFLLKWENSKNYLIEIAEVMPEEQFNFKPTERQMSFQEQLLHIRENMVWLSESYFAGEDDERSGKVSPQSKAAIITELEKAFNKVAELIKKIASEDLGTEVKFFAGPKSKLQLLNLMQDHVTHHRGQLIVYLNLNNIKPPGYSGW